MGEAARYLGTDTAKSDLPPLPQAFADCETLVTSASLGAEATLLTDILTPDALERGFVGIMGRWGPGDRRAAVSLWSQGYFSRLLRPWLAYGLLHGQWFSTQPEHLSVSLSPLSTPAKFGVAFRPLPAGEAMQELLSCHLEPLVALLSTGTGTSAKLHWGNAAFPLHRMFRNIKAMTADLDADPERTARIAEIGARLSADHPFGRMVRLVPQPDAQPVLQRRICCMRYRLDGLAKCKSACPIADA